MSINGIKVKLRTLFHLVPPSTWPLTTALSVFVFLLGLVGTFQQKGWTAFGVVALGLMGILFSLTLWVYDVILESTTKKKHTLSVVKGLRLGFILFLVSEAILFGSFFAAYFYLGINPTLDIGMVFPPVEVPLISALGISLLNTCLLLTSGYILTVYLTRERVHKVRVNPTIPQGFQSIWGSSSKRWYSTTGNRSHKRGIDSSISKTLDQLVHAPRKAGPQNQKVNLVPAPTSASASASETQNQKVNLVPAPTSASASASASETQKQKYYRYHILEPLTDSFFRLYINFIIPSVLDILPLIRELLTLVVVDKNNFAFAGPLYKLDPKTIRFVHFSFSFGLDPSTIRKETSEALSKDSAKWDSRVLERPLDKLFARINHWELAPENVKIIKFWLLDFSKLFEKLVRALRRIYDCYPGVVTWSIHPVKPRHIKEVAQVEREKKTNK